MLPLVKLIRVFGCALNAVFLVMERSRISTMRSHLAGLSALDLFCWAHQEVVK